MFFLSALHRLAAPRDDGLRADLLERLASPRPPAARDNVVAMNPRDREARPRAGPDPKGRVPSGALPGNVLQFTKFGKPSRAVPGKV